MSDIINAGERVIRRSRDDERNPPIGGDGQLQVGRKSDPAETEADNVGRLVSQALAVPGPSAPTSRIRRSATAQASGSSPVVRRKMGFDKSNFSDGTSIKAKAKGHLLRDTSTFADIKTALTEYHKSGNLVTEISLLQSLEELSKKWIKKHDSSLATARGDELDKLRKAITVELATQMPKLSKQMPEDRKQQMQYMEKIEATRTQYAKRFNFLSVQGLEAADWIANAADSTKAQPAALKMMAPTARLALNHKVTTLRTTHGLSEAEATAIAIYTAQDYMYINPGTAMDFGSERAGAEGWMVSQLKSPRYKPVATDVQVKLAGLTGKTEVEAVRQEATQHREVALQGLTKLPDWTGTAYRGKGLDKNQLKSLKKGSTYTEPAFASSSTVKKTAEGFAAKESKGGKVGVLFVVDVTRGRDVAALSMSPENEVLLLPGAGFLVTKVNDENVGVGNLKSKITVIHVKQIG
jgi:hypothetical protein